MPAPSRLPMITQTVLVVLLCWALSPAGAPQDLLAANVLRIGVAANTPVNLDPHMSAGTDAVVAEMVFNGLLRYKPGNSAVIEPDLATAIPKPKTEGGKQVWTFTLRKGVMFQPGPTFPAYELTSDDVVYSLQKAADPMRSAYAGRYAGMTFKTQGPYSVQVVLDRPLSATLFLPRFADRAGGAIICRKAALKLSAEDFQRFPIGTGPFAFKTYSAGLGIELASHNAYFRGAPLLDGVEVVYMPDFAACEQAYQRGELQMMCGQRSSRWAQKAAQWGNTKVDIFGPAESLCLAFNTASGPFSDKLMRQAVAYALNRSEFVDLFGASVAERLYASVPPDITGGVGEQEIRSLGLDYDTDLFRAQEMLRQAGVTARRNLPIELTGQASDRFLYTMLKKQLGRVGIDLVVTEPESGTTTEEVRPRDQALEFRWAQADTADEVLESLVARENMHVSTRTEGFVTGYRKVDVLLEAARRETGLKKQQDIWRHAQLKLLQDMAIYPICAIKYVVARQASVEYGYLLTTCRTMVPPITEKTHILQ